MIGFFVLVLVVVLVLDLWRRDASAFVWESAMFKDQDRNRGRGRGRGRFRRLIEYAGVVTEMWKIKHHFDDGVPVRRGIEF
jgi:hypothetical protein